MPRAIKEWHIENVATGQVLTRKLEAGVLSTGYEWTSVDVLRARRWRGLTSVANNRRDAEFFAEDFLGRPGFPKQTEVRVIPYLLASEGERAMRRQLAEHNPVALARAA